MNKDFWNKSFNCSVGLEFDQVKSVRVDYACVLSCFLIHLLLKLIFCR